MRCPKHTCSSSQIIPVSGHWQCTLCHHRWRRDDEPTEDLAPLLVQAGLDFVPLQYVGGESDSSSSSDYATPVESGGGYDGGSSSDYSGSGGDFGGSGGTGDW